ncbi:hypothetical protein [Flammeovirga sp. OC4]|uniref:hypothetical protein n=1 Tax=Flammeovirga sp. OC4 TaxID=1382345 RepID=UPI0005C78D62|nr:hypothetical protein [Flammeovirga sp. OC4]
MQKDFRIHKVLSYWALRIVPSVILLQSLLYKFGDDAESVYIFTITGLGDDIRLLMAVFEFIAAFFLVYPPLSKEGAGLSVAITSFLLMVHLFIVGVDLPVEGGYSEGLQLFGMTLVAFLTSLLVLEQEVEGQRTYKKQLT